MRLRHSLLLVLGLVAALAACGDDSSGLPPPPPPPVDGGSDMSLPQDASTGEDASTDGDASTAGDGAVDVDGGPIADGGTAPDMCTPPRCPPVPAGCRVEPSADPCVCGEIKCEDAGPGGGVGATCGGITGALCGPGLFCNFTADFDCGFADGTGVCEMRPEICPGLFAPVCGCDGNTYSNRCVAQSAGTDVQSDGECGPVVPPPPPPPPTDCRMTGCPTGSSCQGCPLPGSVIYACIPDGALC
jgi:hypothetical protein